ncbi:hypothetical protein KXD40_001622 [Peronospora effusa]|nr:hypothetical protein KXD40_001622 [Peronospora effusa]
MEKRSHGSSSTTSKTMSYVPSSASARTYGTIADLGTDPLLETRAAASALVGPIPTVPVMTKKAERDGKNIWDEYYPLVQPAHQYHHRNDRGSSNYFFHGMFSADVMWAYRDAVIAYLVALYSMVVLSLTGLVFCKQWGILPNTAIVFGFRFLWFISPAVASLALRNIETPGMQYTTTLEHSAFVSFVQKLPLVKIHTSACALELCSSSARHFRLLLQPGWSTQYVQYVFNRIICMGYSRHCSFLQFNRTFVRKLEMVFSFNDVEALDSGLVFYPSWNFLGSSAATAIRRRAIDGNPTLWCDLALLIFPYFQLCGLVLLTLLTRIVFRYKLVCLCNDPGDWMEWILVSRYAICYSPHEDTIALEIVFSHSTILASAITGCIWALWHWPMIIADALDVVPKGSGYSVAETRDFHLLYVLAVFTLLLVGSRIIMCWIQGNSSYVIWSSVVYHATHNLFITSVFGQLTAPLYDKAQLFSFFSSESSICLLVTVWFSTCILSQMFRWTNLMPMLRRANSRATRALAAYLLRLFMLALAVACLCNAHGIPTSSISLKIPTVILQQVNFEASIELPELKNGPIEDEEGAVLTNGSVKTLDGEGNYQSQLSIAIKQMQLTSYGQHSLTTTVWEKQEHSADPSPAPAPESVVTKTSQLNETDANASMIRPPTIVFDEMLLFRAVHTTSVAVSPGWISLLPPLVTLLMSAVLGQVTVSLLAGIWCGAIIVSNGNPFVAFLRTFDQYWVSAFTVNDHAGVLLFTIILGGTIGVVQKGGGGHGLALVAKTFMTSSLRMQLSTWLLCLVIFFDDYSCILIVGSSLRQVLSQTGVSREKFAAIIHTIGVCLPSMSPVSSWIGVEIGYVAAQLRDLKLDWDPFVTCLSCLHYRFFPILFIAFIFITIICEKDFGPMVQFEKDAAASPITNNGSATPVFPGPMDSPKPELAPLEPDITKPLRWQNAVLPFLSIVVLTFVGMIFDGFDVLYTKDPNGSYGILDALSHCDSVSSLIRASAAGWVIAVTLLLMQHIITLNEATKAWMEGVKDILDPTLILTLAWALGSIIAEVNTAPYIASVVEDSIPKQFLPAIACLLCYIVSFAVGSAFGTMAIMFPIIAPLSWSISGGDADNLRQCFGSILGGSVFGNTCSPIADTSILASLSAHVPLENHIRSILPYAVLVAVVSVAGGSLPIGLKICSTFTAFGVCLAVLLLVVFFFGTRVNTRYRSLSSCSFSSLSPPSRHDGENQHLLSV